MANFSIAVTRRYQSRDEMREDTEWFNVSAWERRAEFVAERVKRGSRVFVDGRLSTREYTAGNGEARTSLDVTANRVLVLSPRETTNEGADPGYPAQRDESSNSSPDANGHGSNGHVTSEYAPTATATQNSTQYDDPNDLENLPW